MQSVADDGISSLVVFVSFIIEKLKTNIASEWHFCIIHPAIWESKDILISGVVLLHIQSGEKRESIFFQTFFDL